MTHQPLSEAEMARAVARGIAQERAKREQRKNIGCLCLVLALVFATVLANLAVALFPGSEVARNVGAIVGLLLPFVLLAKAFR